MSSKAREPPAFISDTKSYSMYERDLKRWAKLTDLASEKQADMVMHCLDGHASGIKENIDNQLSEEKLSHKDGIKTCWSF